MECVVQGIIETKVSSRLTYSMIGVGFLTNMFILLLESNLRFCFCQYFQIMMFYCIYFCAFTAAHAQCSNSIMT